MVKEMTQEEFVENFAKLFRRSIVWMEFDNNSNQYLTIEIQGKQYTVPLKIGQKEVV